MPDTDQLQQLLDMEAIKKVKARYFRHIDTKNWIGFRTIFTDDVHTDLTGSRRDATAAGLIDPVDPHPAVLDTADAFVAAVASRVLEYPTVHHGHMPEIEITSPTTARAIWAMFDIVMRPTPIHGYGHYEEEYRKENGTWKISSLRLTRLLVDRLTRTVPGSGPVQR